MAKQDTISGAALTDTSLPMDAYMAERAGVESKRTGQGLPLFDGEVPTFAEPTETSTPAPEGEVEAGADEAAKEAGTEPAAEAGAEEGAGTEEGGAKADDGDGKPDKEPGNEGELPPAFKRRLARQRNKTAKAQRENDALRKQVKELEDKIAAKPKGEAAPASTAGGDADDDEPIPLRESYETQEAFDAALERWQMGFPADGADEGGSAAAGETSKTEAPKEAGPDPEAEHRATMERHMENLQELLDDPDLAGDRDRLLDEFVQVGRTGALRLSDTMIENLATRDEQEAVELVAAMVDKPREGRRIKLLPEVRQVEAMDELLSKTRKAKTAARKKDAEAERADEGSSKPDEIPAPQPLRGNGSHVQTKSPEKASSTDEYIAIRLQDERLKQASPFPW